MPSKQQQSQNADPFEFAPAWRPDQDDAPTLEGEFTDIAEGYTEYGPYPIVTIKTDAEQMYAWHAMTNIAKGQLTKATPKIGERLRITYGGKHQGKNAAREPYTRWRVENLTHPVTAENLLNKYATESAVNGPSSEFADEPPF